MISPSKKVVSLKDDESRRKSEQVSDRAPRRRSGERGCRNAHRMILRQSRDLEISGERAVGEVDVLQGVGNGRCVGQFVSLSRPPVKSTAVFTAMVTVTSYEFLPLFWVPTNWAPG